MKRIISQLNRKLPELLQETVRPATTLMDYQPQKQQATTGIQNLQTQVPPTKKELWKPQTIQMKSLSQALKWLMEKLPNQTITIEEVVKQAAEEEDLERAAVETAIWRLTQQGQIYQPEPGKIRRI